MDAVRALKQIFLFKDVSEPVLKLVAEVAEVVSFGPGETIADEGETAKALLLIRTGTVRVSSEGKPPVTFGTGEAIGQMALLAGGHVGMTAVARTVAASATARRFVMRVSFPENTRTRPWDADHPLFVDTREVRRLPSAFVLRLRPVPRAYAQDEWSGPQPEANFMTGAVGWLRPIQWCATRSLARTMSSTTRRIRPASDRATAR